MSSAFPQAASPFGAIANPVPVPDRNTHIPAFYVRNPHTDPSTIVKQDGVPLMGVDKKPYTIAQVAEERRWAVGLDGEVMDQTDFHVRLGENRLEFYAMQRQMGNPNAQFDGDIQREHVPAVQDYVCWEVDPQDPGKLRMIGYDPHGTDGAKPEAFVDSQGERIEEARLDILHQAYVNPKLRKSLQPSEIAEVEAYLGVEPGTGSDGIASKLELLTEMRTNGEITDEAYIAKVAALTGAPAPETAPKEIEQAPAEFVSACKRTWKNELARKTHERHHGCAVSQAEGDTT
jgi:hypothetical protein